MQKYTKRVFGIPFAKQILRSQNGDYKKQVSISFFQTCNNFC